MLIKLELNTNDAEALLRHCDAFQPGSGDYREDARLADALGTLGSAITDGMNTEESMETVDPRVLEAATALFGDPAIAIDWLFKPLRALGGKRPLDVDIEAALNLIGRLEHGFGA
ncbi:antitoxin Xre/MbcA/ParS toxin-binding domain-containing protein [Pseudomonas sp. NPDC086278]|uniref:antitoxin Xre/MbcA/ParS toxin-binding domain-containing protein n=1 Tax=Pseudomonas sp. NPDC086278 TaxID=3390646 RepID=UPI003D064B27